VADPEEGLGADGTIQTGARRDRVPAVFYPMLADAIAFLGESRASLYVYGSVANGTARSGSSDLDLLSMLLGQQRAPPSTRRSRARPGDGRNHRCDRGALRRTDRAVDKRPCGPLATPSHRVRPSSCGARGTSACSQPLPLACRSASAAASRRTSACNPVFRALAPEAAAGRGSRRSQSSAADGTCRPGWRPCRNEQVKLSVGSFSRAMW
jgi:Nucleotidyltransferase domain